MNYILHIPEMDIRSLRCEKIYGEFSEERYEIRTTCGRRIPGNLKEKELMLEAVGAIATYRRYDRLNSAIVECLDLRKIYRLLGYNYVTIQRIGDRMISIRYNNFEVIGD